MNDMELLKKLSSIQKAKSNTAVQTQGDSGMLSQTEEKHVKDRIPVHWLLVLKSGIAGMYYHVNADPDHGAQVLGKLVPGTELILERDYKNEHDQWAIAIYSPEKEMLGYMTRYKNETIARLMDYGRIFHAIVDKPIDESREIPNINEIKTPTENFDLPYSVYMEEEGYGENEDAGGEKG
ncbi:MAG: HIRAN domain-containing protein [Eubacteriales bacterium]|nr:HIRAN domain-containing protein [Eubacteriales bacterium]